MSDAKRGAKAAPSGDKHMDGLVIKAGSWLALALLALVMAALAVDAPFAVHMSIIAIAALIVLWATVSNADYGAMARGLLNMPANEGVYDDDPIRWGVIATLFWGIAGMAAGLFIALQLAFPALNFNLEYTTFGRIRPLHTSAVIFAFGGNALIATSYYVVQRTCRARLAFPKLARFVFWGYQLFIVLAATGYLMGITEAKEYAEPEWYVDLWLTIVWVSYLAVFVGTIVKRREPHIYVANWFYLSFIITIAMLHLVNNLSMPASIFGSKSYAAFAGVQDALTQWWYGHNAVGFFLTAGFLAMMYYFVPKQAERPVYSYRLSIIHFWALIFLYIWAGPHHLHYTALPDWAQTLGMVFSIMLWMPSWGGMINGLMTLNGAWDKIRTDPITRMFVMSLAFYGMSTFEGPMMSIKSVNAVSHFTDWTIGHVHAGALGWNAFLSFAILYWAIPRLWKTQLYSTRLATAHFWTSTVGLITYQVSMWVAGLTQWAMWRAFEPDGRLTYPDFIETVVRIIPMYWVRLGGGLLFFAGLLMMCWNIFKTIKTAPADYAVEPEVHAPPRVNDDAAPGAVTPANTYDYALYRLQHATRHGFHRVLERRTVTFTVLTVLALSVGSLVEGLPMFFNKSNVKEIASVKPYTPLEVVGRDIYVREGCYNCHSQLVRPFRYETERYGEYSKAGEYIYDRPFQWGSKRTGPDLHRVGGKYPSLWHVRHMDRPDSTTPGSIMPRYPHLLTRTFDTSLIRRKLEVLPSLIPI